MNKSIKAAQGGFTLIELIVVIVILGILAATALPKFASLGGEARLASLNAAKGALSASSAMLHGKYLVAPSGTITVEGTAVTMNTTSGYPSVTDATAQAVADAAGLSTNDYKVYVSGNGTTEPALASGSGKFAIVPASIVGTATAAKCFVLYTGATAANSAPTVIAGTTGTPATAALCE